MPGRSGTTVLYLVLRIHLDPNPQQSYKAGAVEAQNGATMAAEALKASLDSNPYFFVYNRTEGGEKNQANS